MLTTASLTQKKAWKELEILSKSDFNIKQEFANNPHRFDELHIESKNYLFDFSKNRLDKNVIKTLIDLAEECQLKPAISAFFSGEKINKTEHRAVMHTALRSFSLDKIEIDAHNVLPDIQRVRQQMKEFSEAIILGKHIGFTGKKITDVVNIGIGGSDLGPKMVCNALKSYKNHLNVHFVSNVDSQHLAEVLLKINAETTLFIVASKTFTTQETMANAFSARKWFLQFAKEKDIEKHFVALSTNTKAVTEFGISPENTFEFWDWVGGRYSLWSAIGLSICLAVGYDNFELLLKGAEHSDTEFRTLPFEKNTAVIMALIGVWNRNFLNCSSHAVLCYNQYLDEFATFLQQADMESNGKSIDKNGVPVNYATGPIIWGEPGTNGQHAFYQHLHQGTDCIPSDFIAFAKSNRPLGEHQNLLIANFFAQTQALAFGKTETEVLEDMKESIEKDPLKKEIVPFKVFDGNRPSNSLLFTKLNPFTLGQLIALYEHKIFVQGIIWNIYSFDQWGVELGKVLAQKMLPELGNPQNSTTFDASSNGLINYYKLHK